MPAAPVIRPNAALLSNPPLDTGRAPPDTARETILRPLRMDR